MFADLEQEGPSINRNISVAPLVSTPLVLQPVASDGFTFTGSATTLLDHSGTAEDGDGTDDGIVEAPALVKEGSTYFLFFSPGYVLKEALCKREA